MEASDEEAFRSTISLLDHHSQLKPSPKISNEPFVRRSLDHLSGTARFDVAASSFSAYSDEVFTLPETSWPIVESTSTSLERFM